MAILRRGPHHLNWSLWQAFSRRRTITRSPITKCVCCRLFALLCATISLWRREETLASVSLCIASREYCNLCNWMRCSACALLNSSEIPGSVPSAITFSRILKRIIPVISSMCVRRFPFILRPSRGLGASLSALFTMRITGTQFSGPSLNSASRPLRAAKTPRFKCSPVPFAQG